MKSTQGQSILLYLLAGMMVLISGCSETTKEAPPQPDIIFPVSFPLIVDAKLYSVEANIHFGLPAEDENASAHDLIETHLLDFPGSLVLALDTDPSQRVNEDDEDSYINTALPEYIAYADKHTLRLYDLNTRHVHEVYSFENDPLNEFTQENSTEETESDTEVSFICDLQKVITWDEEPRLSKVVLLKDELAVYVKTSSLEDCSEPQEGYQYWQINIVESSDTYTIRRKTLKPHSHQHKHFHDHDDENYEYADIHDHVHLLEKGERDENGEEFEPNDHQHKHNHSHDFIYGQLHEHEHLTQEEIDSVHTDSKNQEIVIETLPVLIGRKTTLTSIDEALMYSGQPLINLQARNFGYLGLNSKENSFKFYEVDIDTLEKRLLWSTQSDNLDNIVNSPGSNTSWRTLVPKYNRFINHTNINNKVAIFTNKHLFYFSLESLFDDDMSEERENILDNPLFTSSHSDPRLYQRSHYNSSNLKMVITENFQLWQIDFDEDVPQAKIIRTFNENDLVEIEAKMMESEIMVIKRFNSNETHFTSIAAIHDSGVEVSTILNITEDTVSVFNQGGNSFLNIKSSEPDNRITAKLLSENFVSPFSTLTDTLWLNNTLDYRGYLEEEKVSQFSSENLSILPGTIELPDIYLVDTTEPLARGEQVGSIPDTVSDVSGLVLFNEHYTIIEYQNSNNETLYWYWITAFN